MTDYITLEEVDTLANRLGFTYRSRGLMASALGSPMPVFGQEVYENLHQKSAALLVAVNRNHPMLDGNKRMSWLITAAFYDINGWDLIADTDDLVAFVLSIANDGVDMAFDDPVEVAFDDVVAWLEDHAQPRAWED